ncbi:SpoIIE family protein phosphatase [Paludibaculum fermentans]
MHGNRGSSAEELLEQIVSAVREFGGPEPQDDVTLLVARGRPS